MSDANTEALKPCAFCGETTALDDIEFDYGGGGPPPCYSVRCANCGAMGPCGYGKERDDHYHAKRAAIAAWNERATPPAVAEVNVQESERERFDKMFSDAINRANISAADMPHTVATKLRDALWQARSALPAAVQVPKQRMKTPAASGPITGEAIAQRMMQICGCQGQHDCDCVSVLNQARSELWYEHNTSAQGGENG